MAALARGALGKGAKKQKKLTNVSLYVCMSAGNSEMLVFLSVFFSNNAHFSSFLMVAWGKKQKNVSFYGVCMYVRPKLTFVSFYFCFFAPSPKQCGNIMLGGKPP